MNKVNENKCNKDIKNYDGNVFDLLTSVVKEDKIVDYTTKKIKKIEERYIKD